MDSVSCQDGRAHRAAKPRGGTGAESRKRVNSVMSGRDVASHSFPALTAHACAFGAALTPHDKITRAASRSAAVRALVPMHGPHFAAMGAGASQERTGTSQTSQILAAVRASPENRR
jgi:hypothetical protein